VKIEQKMQEQSRQKALETKIANKVAIIKTLRKENRRLRQRIVELESSRSHWKEKLKSTKEVSHRSSGRVCEEKSKGYFYDNSVIKLGVYLYAVVGCGYRGIVKILLYMELEYGIVG
jgi:hypothetical protein